LERPRDGGVDFLGPGVLLRRCRCRRRSRDAADEQGQGQNGSEHGIVPGEGRERDSLEVTVPTWARVVYAVTAVQIRRCSRFAASLRRAVRPRSPEAHGETRTPAQCPWLVRIDPVGERSGARRGGLDFPQLAQPVPGPGSIARRQQTAYLTGQELSIAGFGS